MLEADCSGLEPLKWRPSAEALSVLKVGEEEEVLVVGIVAPLLEVVGEAVDVLVRKEVQVVDWIQIHEHSSWTTANGVRRHLPQWQPPDRQQAHF